MRTSPEGIQLIEESEDFKNKLYNCPAGHCTIGFGTLIHKGPCCGAPSEAPYENGITIEWATQLLRTEVTKAEASVCKLVKVPIDQSEFDALIDFEYNLGAGKLADSTLLKLLNAGKYDAAAAEFMKWVYADHKKLSGLAMRRSKEKALFDRDLPRKSVTE